MQDRPDAPELLEAVEAFLREQSGRSADRWMRFQLLVAANSIGIVRRELLLDDGFVREEWARVDALLGPEPIPARPGDLHDAVRRRNQDLCDAIAKGAFDDPAKESQLVAHLWQTVIDQAKIASPKALEPGEE